MTQTSKRLLSRVFAIPAIASALCFSSFSFSTIAAEKSPMLWAEGYCEGAESQGANREYYNRGALFKWQNYMGDWRDRQGHKQGADAFAELNIPDLDAQQQVQIDVGELVTGWHAGQFPNQGMVFKANGGNTQIISKEHPDTQLHPQLQVITNGGSYQFTPDADTGIYTQTYTCFGMTSEFSTTGNLLFYFDLSQIPESEEVVSATLSLSTVENQYGAVNMSLFRVAIEPEHYGSGSLASAFPNDYTIAFDSPGIFAEAFESDDWINNWSFAYDQQNLRLVTENNEEGFVPLMGKALEITMRDDDRSALNVGYLFADKIGHDVESVYFRYYLRFGRSWQTLDGGKLPGLAGTYAGTAWQGGWGGRRSNGTNGWSARGVFELLLKEGNTYEDHVPAGNYIYHADQPSAYGDVVIWDGQAPGLMEKERWYSIEQYVQMNTPGENDGILRTWIDGVPAYEKSDLRFRDEGYEHIKIDRVWMNIFHGGVINNDRFVKAFIDNVVIATDYVGPIHFDEDLPKAGFEPNRLPEISNELPVHSTIVGEVDVPLNFSISAIDPDGDALTIEWLLNGEVVSVDTMQFSFTPLLFQLGDHVIEVRVTDSEGGQAVRQWQVSLDPQNWQKVTVSEDTVIVGHSYGSFGTWDVVRVMHNQSVYLRFVNLPNLELNQIKSAYLVLFDDKQYGDIDLSVYAGGQAWFEGTHYQDGSTRQYIDYQNQVEWNNYLGDYVDANGVENGFQPFTVTVIEDTDTPRLIAVDVLPLLQSQWHEGQLNIVLKSTGSGKQDFHTKEHSDVATHPRLMLEQY